MRILFVSRFATPIVYDAFSFLLGLKPVELLPCSYGSVRYDKGFIPEMREMERIHFPFIPSATALEEVCKKNRIDLLVFCWMLEIRELRKAIASLDRPILLFPHNETPLLRRLARRNNVFIFHPYALTEPDRNRFESHFFASRRFSADACRNPLDGSIFFCGDSNFRMKRVDKLETLGILASLSREIDMTVCRNLLASLFPYRAVLLRKAVQKLLRGFRLESMRDRLLGNPLQRLDHVTGRLRKLGAGPGLRLIDQVPYAMLAAEIARHAFAEVTPYKTVDILPSRATIALASGVPLLLRSGKCLPLENIIRTHANGVVYDDRESLLHAVRDNGVLGTLARNATDRRHLFTLEHRTREFLEFLISIPDRA